jgi:predicted MFS family arabinose efflux permease
LDDAAAADALPAPPGTRPDGDRGMAALGWLFGTIYFVQGIAEPTQGLITQPVRSLLKAWGHSVAEIAAFSAIISLPWAIKPLYGLLTDFVPLAGSRRRSYLIATSALTTLGLLYLYLRPPQPGSFYSLMLLLLVPTFGVAFSDVVVDGFMIDKGQPRGITGQLQSIQWGANYAATIAAATIGGYLAQHGRQDLGFLICAGITAVALVLAVFAVGEDRPAVPTESVGSAARAVFSAVRNPTVLAVAAFLFLWTFNPFSMSVLYLFMTREMGLSEQFYGNNIALLAAGAVAASFAYGFYCRRVPFGALIHLSIVTGVASTAAYWLMKDAFSATLVTVAVGFTYMTAWLIQLDLAARICPPRVAATLFALLMALTNLSLSLAAALGGYLYDLWAPQWGPRTAFDALVGLGCAFTAGCWLLVPWLKRGDWKVAAAEAEARVEAG